MFGSYNRLLHSRRGYDKIAVLCWLVESLVQDCNFDDIAEKFSRNIYGTTKGQLRQAILWQDSGTAVGAAGAGTAEGAGCRRREGQTAIKVAQLGHHVTLCDLSAETAARARQAAADKGVIRQHAFCTMRGSGYCAAFGKPGRFRYCFMRCWSGWRSPRKYCIPCGRRCVLAVDCH